MLGGMSSTMWNLSPERLKSITLALGSLSPTQALPDPYSGGQSVLGEGKGPPAGSPLPSCGVQRAVTEAQATTEGQRRKLVLSFLDLLLRFAFFFVIPVLSHHWIFLFF